MMGVYLSQMVRWLDQVLLCYETVQSIGLISIEESAFQTAKMKRQEDHLAIET